MPLRGIWHSKTAWTHGTIGAAHAWGEESPFGDFLKERLGAPWRYWKEYRDIDLVLSKHANLQRPYLWTTEKEIEDWPDRFCPKALDIVFEHEDSCGISWQEIVKLVHVRAKLKVLVTYTSDLNSTEESVKESERHIEGTYDMFLEMIRQAWLAFPEDPATEYLLLIGQLDERGGEAKINWYRTSFGFDEGAERVEHEGPIIQANG